VCCDGARGGAGDQGMAKAAALAARGMRHTLDRIVMRREVRHADEPPAPHGMRWLAGADLDRAEPLEVHDDSFAEIPLTAPATPGDLDRMPDGASAWPEGTSLPAAAASCGRSSPPATTRPWAGTPRRASPSTRGRPCGT